MRIRMTLCALIGAAAACGGSSPTGGGGGTPPPPGPATQTVTMSEYTFSPSPITVTAGTTVRWVNNGTLVHTATSDAGDSLSWNSGSVGAPGTDPYGGKTPGGSYELTFTKVGSYPYHCSFHGTTFGMTGRITVTP